MQLLKYLCLLVAIVSLSEALGVPHWIVLTGINTQGGQISAFGRSFAVAFACVFAGLAYGIHKRSRITLHAGIALLLLSYVRFVVGAILSLYHTAHVRDFPSFWLPAVSIALLGGAVVVFWYHWWTRWWKRLLDDRENHLTT